MPTIIPTSTEPYYQQRTALEGRDYLLRFRYHARIGRWYLDVYDQDDEPIAVGLKIVCGAVIGATVRDERWPPGRIVAVDLEAPEGSPGEADPALCSLGARFLLFYFDSTEV